MVDAEPSQNQGPGASSRSLRRVLGPKALCRPGLLSLTPSRELDGKWGPPGHELVTIWDQGCAQGEDFSHWVEHSFLLMHP